MRIVYLAKMRPLFVVAQVLCWNAVGLSLSDRVLVNTCSLALLASAALALAMLVAGVKYSVWVRELVLRPGADYQYVSGALFLCGTVSFVLAASAFIKASQLAQL
ncbi:hypothetical protein JM946_21460 [Steroidobacter sp. S1-65]|uniref:Uncharacterized protein n=1 Tax=Steroidobacter gossypii TaxID=2805490 RepID=A0ABS1X272_9GAMM|nr:hypothetical protein [Steroidobacter gossypii]MBM0107314.1 hypothetical protein [Steroidobacter gossypii]